MNKIEEALNKAIKMTTNNECKNALNVFLKYADQLSDENLPDDIQDALNTIDKLYLKHAN